ncbi:HNH endonuclease signature motif containing protein [Phytomonospora sp. NPDC050363]|uniref:HNH endonuclease n=1 Tax=Phytomonospora sp. NPDC050363 TaxID=3155642 RepID=UPI00340FABE0
MAWENSTRRQRLPPDWPTLRRYVLDRDHWSCQWPTSTGIPCPAPATDVDHIEPGDDHDPANLRPLCGWHHQRKCSAEGGCAAAARRSSRRRPPEPHPGAIT